VIQFEQYKMKKNKNNKTTTKETYEIPHDEIAREFSQSNTCKVKNRNIFPIVKLIKKHNKTIKKWVVTAWNSF